MTACAHPVQLRLSDDRVVAKACGSRRQDRCPSCAALYQGDVYQLIAAGLRGGKGVPSTVVKHPAVFVTATAPAFGWPYRPDYRRGFIWNYTASALWRRTITYTARTLARFLGVTQRRFARMAKLSYVRVAEYQSRGLIHIHAIVRIDRAMPKYRADQIRPPGYPFSTKTLKMALLETMRYVTAPVADGFHCADRMSWGDHHVREIANPSDDAGRIARYASKDVGKPPGDGSSNDSDGPYGDKGSQSGMTQAGYDMGDDSDDSDFVYQMNRTAPKLGYRGHTMTKSRKFSTTLKALRMVRAMFRNAENEERGPDPSQRFRPMDRQRQSHDP